MNRTAKIIISLILALTMMFTLAGVAFADSYVSLGDSLSNGCGLDNFERTDGVDDRGYMRVVEGSYPKIFADTMGLDFYPRAFSAFRAEELLFVLDPEFAGDDMIQRRYCDEGKHFEQFGGADAIREELNEILSEAEYASVTLGSNNFGIYFIYQLEAWMDGEPYAFDRPGYSAKSKLLASQGYKEIEKTLVDTLKAAGKATDFIKVAVESLKYTYTGFFECFEGVIERLYEINPDITIIVNGMQNPFRGMHLVNNMLDIGAVVDVVINHVNDYLKEEIIYADSEQYIYVDITDVSVKGFPNNVLDEEFFEFMKIPDLNPYTHPDAEGQAYIAQEMVNTLKVPYYDVDVQDKFFEAVAYVHENELVDGKKTHEFAPYSLATRAMTATALYRLAGSGEIDSDVKFTDVSEGKYYTEAVKWAVEEGIMKGITSKVFSPMSGMTRQKLVTALWKAAGEPETDYDISGYKDARLVAKASRTAMAWAAENGLLDGLNEASDKLLPLNLATKADLAQILLNYAE